jgi:hypothetical protein
LRSMRNNLLNKGEHSFHSYSSHHHRWAARLLSYQVSKLYC